MSDEPSNLAPEFDERTLTRMADNYDDLIKLTPKHGMLYRELVTYSAALRNAIDAYDRLRDRCLLSETRERLTLARLAELERQ